MANEPLELIEARVGDPQAALCALGRGRDLEPEGVGEMTIERGHFLAQAVLL